ncbi:hypothetical protein LAZ67_5003791 [Cordylochernes scorpioides]|uniref:Reverse transcriptase n=1 Tax=Cordylochernes scorpioides TaxID=51811 RepID=A0ABY6KIN9_9ARAC|nr:hypothetical protein LAZ67_5003791 [Cordylochernes scorpioides]
MPLMQGTDRSDLLHGQDLTTSVGRYCDQGVRTDLICSMDKTSTPQLAGCMDRSDLFHGQDITTSVGRYCDQGVRTDLICPMDKTSPPQLAGIVITIPAIWGVHVRNMFDDNVEEFVEKNLVFRHLQDKAGQEGSADHSPVDPYENRQQDQVQRQEASLEEHQAQANVSAFIIKTGSPTQWQADLAPKEMAASDMRNRRHVQPLLTWSTNTAHPVDVMAGIVQLKTKMVLVDGSLRHTSQLHCHGMEADAEETGLQINGQITASEHLPEHSEERAVAMEHGMNHTIRTFAIAERKLNLFINNSQITHSEHPKYLGIHLDRTLTFKIHLTKLKGKLSSRNNILHKLAGSSWGSDANTLRTSALALIFSTAEYCAPVWEGSCHTKLIDTQLNSTLRIITGVCQPTRIDWLPVLAHISPPELRRKEATKKILPPNHRLKSRKPIWSRGNQLLSQNFNISEAWTNSWISSDIPNKNLITSPSVKIPGFSLPRREWVLLNRFRTGQGRCAELMKLWGYTKDPNCACNVPQSMSHILDDCPLYKFNGGISNLHSVTPEALNWLKALPLRL